MFEQVALTAVATATAMLMLLLLSLRTRIAGRRPALVLLQRWLAAGAPSAALVLAPIGATAAVAFAALLTGDTSASRTVPHAAASSAASAYDGDEDLTALRSYAQTIDAPTEQSAAADGGAALPDVDAMIAKLVQRLQDEPGDIKGWKMLGWSYLNTGKPQEAAKAYATALQLAPGDAEIKKGLDAAAAAEASGPSSSSPAGKNAAAPGAGADAGQNAQNAQSAMIRSMVDRLATRLEASPRDEQGWLNLMRSRMTLGERDAAKAAYGKAQDVFAGDPEAKARLATAARELGVESN